MSQFSKSSHDSYENIPGIFGIRLGDQPSYEVIANEGPVEVRYYDPQTLASVSVKGNGDDAFLCLARYIYGQNTETKSIARIAPTVKNESMTSFFMTAPLLHTKNGNETILSIVLPQEFTLSTAPAPLDRRIFLLEKPSHLRAVIKDLSQSNVLFKWIESNSQYTQIGKMQIAQYNSPQSLPFLKRDELHIEIAEKQ